MIVRAMSNDACMASRLQTNKRLTCVRVCSAFALDRARMRLCEACLLNFSLVQRLWKFAEWFGVACKHDAPWCLQDSRFAKVQRRLELSLCNTNEPQALKSQYLAAQYEIRKSWLLLDVHRRA